MDITAQIVDDFRDWYPEFSDDTDYPDATVTRALCIADEETGSTRWGTYNYAKCSRKVRGLFAYAAHYMTIRGLAQAAASSGGAVTAPTAVTSKSVGDESASYAVATPSDLNQQAQYGDLLTTVYGQEFVRLRKAPSIGAVVV